MKTVISDLDKAFDPKNFLGNEEIVLKTKEVANLIFQKYQNSRERSLVITNLEQAMLWLDAASKRKTNEP